MKKMYMLALLLVGQQVFAMEIGHVTKMNVEEDNKIEFKLNYPYFEQPSESEKTFNSIVDDIVDTETGNFRSMTYNVDRENLPLELAKMNSTFTMDYKVVLISTGSTPLVSILFTIDSYVTGGAHPNTTHRTLNFDFQSQNAFAIADLFKPTYNFTQPLNHYIAKQLSAIVNQTEKEMVASNEINYANWNITKDGLLITMDEFPHVFGNMQTLIPYSEMKPYLNFNGLLSQCLSKQKLVCH